MKILYVCHRFPFPPKRGGKIRPFNMISHLSKNHQVVVASLVRSEEEAKEGSGLSAHCEKYYMQQVSSIGAWSRMIARVPTFGPSSMGYFYSAALKNNIDYELNSQEYDLIFVHCSSVAQYVENVRGVPKILDFGDMDSQKWLTYSKVRSFPLSLGYALEGTKMERAERRLARKFDYCTCTTKAELETLNSFGVDVPTGWFPNGVDTHFFTPSTTNYDADIVCFIGRMDYYPNQECMFDFCKNTFPLIRNKRPNAKLVIIGANPSSAVLRLGEIAGVTVTGSVADVRPYVCQSAVNVAPLNIARGTQNKILESLAMGVPVVSSEQAAGGIDAIPGEHFLVASSPQEYADAIVGLMDDPVRRQHFSTAGRERMQSNHDWSASMRRMDAIIEDCVTRFKKRAVE